MSENELKKKIDQIKKYRKIFIKDMLNKIYSDTIFLYGIRINKKFREFLIEKKIFEQYIYKIITKKKKKKSVKFLTNDYLLLRNLRFSRKDKDITYFASDEYGLYRLCPYYQEYNFNIINLDGEIWFQYELILNKIKKAIPLYQEFVYSSELKRLCDKQYIIMCEKCGSKNEKCAIFCNMCGEKLNYD